MIDIVALAVLIVAFTLILLFVMAALSTRNEEKSRKCMQDILIKCSSCGDNLGRIGMFVNYEGGDTGKVSNIGVVCNKCLNKREVEVDALCTL